MKCNLVLVLALLVIDAGAQSISRKAVFLKGQQFTRVYTGALNVVIKLGAAEQKTQNSFTRTSDITIEDVLDTSYLISSVLTRITQKKGGGGKNESYDSDDTAGGNNGDWVGDLRKKLGNTYHMVVNKKGYLVLSDDTTDVKTSVAGIPGNLNNRADRIGESYELIANLPARELRQGDSWVDSSVSKDSREITKHTLTSLSQDEAIIDIQGTVASEVTIGEGKIKTVLKMAGGGTAKVICDPRTGIVRKIEHDYNTTGTIFMQEQEFPFTLKSVHSVLIATKKL
jgi:hypothetical protein